MSKHTESKVRVGERIAWQADTYNGLMDVLRAYRRPDFEGGQSGDPLTAEPRLDLYVLNDDIVDLNDPYQVLRITGTVANLETDFLNAFRTPALTGEFPSHITNQIVITQQSIQKDCIGRACIVGLTPVKLLVVSNEHNFARPVNGHPEYLETATSGPARIIWKHNVSAGDPDIRHALVYLIGPANTDLSDTVVVSGAIGCGWIKGVRNGDCFTLTLRYPLDVWDVPDPLQMLWEGGPTVGLAKAAIDPDTDLPAKFIICDKEYDVIFFEDTYGNIAMTLTDGDGNEYVLTLDKCTDNGAYFTGAGVPDCWANRPATGIATPPPSTGAFVLQLEWGGTGCVVDYTTCTAAFEPNKRELSKRLFVTIEPNTGCSFAAVTFPVDFVPGSYAPGTIPVEGYWQSEMPYSTFSGLFPLNTGANVVSKNNPVVIAISFHCWTGTGTTPPYTSTSVVRCQASIIVKGTVNNLGGGGGTIANQEIFKPSILKIVDTYAGDPVDSSVTWEPFSVSGTDTVGYTDYVSQSTSLSPCTMGTAATVKITVSEHDPS